MECCTCHGDASPLNAPQIDENGKFRAMLIDRPVAESVYGDSIYDERPVPASVNKLRLVALEEWNINASIRDVVKTTGEVGQISIDKLTYKGDSQTLLISFAVQPGSETPDVLSEPEVITSPSECPPKFMVLPPGEAQLQSDAFVELFGLERSTNPAKPADEIDYDKLIREFGCQKITQEQLDRMERLIKRPVHPYLRRGLFFSHRGLDQLLDAYEKGTPFFIYTGRGPSSGTLHLGHLVPFLFTRWLQEVFQAPVVIMLSDDEKFLFREELEYDQVRHMARENARDIVACGFDPDLTFIFRNTDFIGDLYGISLRMQKKTTFNQVKGIFGFNPSSNIGSIAYPAIEGAAAFCQAYPKLFGRRGDMLCLVPQGIDQDPFFRMTRDLAPRLGYLKPVSIHSKFIPSLLGVTCKMSSSVEGSAIYVTDTPAVIRSKIHKYAFSGGRDTAEEHRRLGANLDVDVSYHYLRFFLDDDEKLNDIATKYRAGEIMSSAVKDTLVEIICGIMDDYKPRGLQALLVHHLLDGDPRVGVEVAQLGVLRHDFLHVYLRVALDHARPPLDLLALLQADLQRPPVEQRPEALVALDLQEQVAAEEHLPIHVDRQLPRRNVDLDAAALGARGHRGGNLKGPQRLRPNVPARRQQSITGFPAGGNPELTTPSFRRSQEDGSPPSRSWPRHQPPPPSPPRRCCASAAPR
ncbi:tryptophanyl-tRNA synthetase [Babesia caballi]|uniref:Tryptophan--tRNA ligase, cytoplasmic n=1 Tax=Babesia caballi TaxID=5871 RepID=A0AAV4LTA3_BABCB|nr:tryptophanyl-tRNA synthetase [Babesia caballi]